jgi:hypothetical protein
LAHGVILAAGNMVSTAVCKVLASTLLHMEIRSWPVGQSFFSFTAASAPRAAAASVRRLGWRLCAFV